MINPPGEEEKSGHTTIYKFFGINPIIIRLVVLSRKRSVQIIEMVEKFIIFLTFPSGHFCYMMARESHHI